MTMLVAVLLTLLSSVWWALGMWTGGPVCVLTVVSYGGTSGLRVLWIWLG